MSADFSRLASACDSIARSADMVHLDITDGYFAPTLTMGPQIVAGIRKLTKLPLDVHLMLENPERFVEPFRDVGADRIAVHWEACRDPMTVLADIRHSGALAGIALTIDTPVSVVRPLLEIADYVVILSVELRSTSHGFQPIALDKVRELVTMRGQRSRPQVELDGAITLQTAGWAKAAGAEILVAGGAVFQTENPEQAIRGLRNA